MPSTLTRPKRSNRVKSILREELGLGKGKVDRVKGVIYGVKICGRTSQNTHGVHGVSGTDYTQEALQEAAELEEGMCVNVDHPPRTNPNQDRSARDRFAWLENVVVQESGSFGDLHFLDPTDPLSVKIMNAAELKPDAYALSHNARGEGEVREGRYVVTSIPEVRSVDLVAYGGSNKSLFESQKPMKTLKSVLESVGIPKKALKVIWEMDGMLPGMDATAEPEAKEEETYEVHIGKAICAILNDESLTPEIKKKKILQAVKLVSDDEEKPADAPLEEGDDAPDEKKESTDEKGEKEKDMKESLAMARVKELENKLALKDLCESLTFKPSPLQNKILLGLDPKDRKEFIKEAQVTIKKNSSAPRTNSTAVLESAGFPTDAKEQLAFLRQRN